MKKCIIKIRPSVQVSSEHDYKNDLRIYTFDSFTEDEIQFSDTYHTMDELYEHRITLFIALCKQITHQPYNDENKFGVWRSTFHSDGSAWEGWFILGIFKEKGKQITYHLPISKWEETNFAETLEKAPEYDGHTSQDVLDRLKNL